MRVNLRWYDHIVLNTSAGKDSQATMGWVVARAKDAGVLDRVVAVHCDLGEEEWEGTRELAEEHARHYGLRFEVVKRRQGGILQHVLDPAAQHGPLADQRVGAAARLVVDRPRHGISGPHEPKLNPIGRARP